MQRVAYAVSAGCVRGQRCGEVGDELNRLSKQGEWVAMGDLISDDMIAEFAVVGDVDSVRKEILSRFGGVVDRVQMGLPNQSLRLND